MILFFCSHASAWADANLENYEDDTIGNSPTSSWYTYTENGDMSHSNVSLAPGSGHGSNSYHIYDDNLAVTAWSLLTLGTPMFFDTANPLIIQFYFYDVGFNTRVYFANNTFGGADSLFYIEFMQGDLYYYELPSSGEYFVGAYTTGAWQHLVLRCDPGADNVDIYLNGVDMGDFDASWFDDSKCYLKEMLFVPYGMFGASISDIFFDDISVSNRNGGYDTPTTTNWFPYGNQSNKPFTFSGFAYTAPGRWITGNFTYYQDNGLSADMVILFLWNWDTEAWDFPSAYYNVLYNETVPITIPCGATDYYINTSTRQVWWRLEADTGIASGETIPDAGIMDDFQEGYCIWNFTTEVDAIPTCTTYLQGKTWNGWIPGYQIPLPQGDPVTFWRNYSTHINTNQYFNISYYIYDWVNLHWVSQSTSRSKITYNKTQTFVPDVGTLRKYLWRVEITEDGKPTVDYPGSGSTLVMGEYWYRIYFTSVQPTITFIYPTLTDSVTPNEWKQDHTYRIQVYDPDSTYSVRITQYMTSYAWDWTMDTAYLYNASLVDASGYLNITLPGEHWVPSYGDYLMDVNVTCDDGVFYAVNLYNIGSQTAITTEVSLAGFSPANGDYLDYIHIGKSIEYWMHSKSTVKIPYAHIYLTDENGKLITQFHSDGVDDFDVPMNIHGQPSVFTLFQRWSSKLQVDHYYRMYIGFNTDSQGWDATTLSLQLLYDDATIVPVFSADTYVGVNPSQYVREDDSLGNDFYGIRVDFGTFRSEDAMDGYSGLGESTGGDWGTNLGEQIDSATGVTGSGIVLAMVIIAIFACLPILIMRQVPPLPILIAFADMGFILDFGMGLLPLWIFFVAVIVVTLFFIYKVKTWLTQGNALSGFSDKLKKSSEGVKKK